MVGVKHEVAKQPQRRPRKQEQHERPVPKRDTAAVLSPTPTTTTISTTATTTTTPSIHPTAGKLSPADFCRLASTAVTQNTKSRSHCGFRDDSGYYHAMYRYGIGQMVNLFAPAELARIRCCNKVYDLNGIKVHVTKVHDGTRQKSSARLSPA